MKNNNLICVTSNKVKKFSTKHSFNWLYVYFFKIFTVLCIIYKLIKDEHVSRNNSIIGKISGILWNYILLKTNSDILPVVELFLGELSESSSKSKKISY